MQPQHAPEKAAEKGVIFPTRSLLSLLTLLLPPWALIICHLLQLAFVALRAALLNKVFRDRPTRVDCLCAERILVLPRCAITTEVLGNMPASRDE